jgi:beta-lactam-binding protein with PASTA domain
MRVTAWIMVLASTGCAGSASWSSRGLGGGGGAGGEGGRAGGGTQAPAAVAMPDLTLMTRAEAEAVLKQAGFTAAPELDAFACGSTLDDKRVIELGRVCYQTPAPGRQASTAIPVKLRVQNENPWRGEYRAGRSWFLMPDFAGTDVEVAKAKMRELGFIAKEVKISYVVEAGCKPSTVCRTTPQAWSRADSSSDKLFIVGQPPEQVGASGATTKPQPASGEGKPKDPPATTPPATTKPADIF